MAVLDERVESAIDAAARQMTEGELSPDFRASVLARIGNGDHAARPWPSAWALSALGVAGVVILAALTLRAPWRSWPAATPSSASAVAPPTPRPEVGLLAEIPAKPDAHDDGAIPGGRGAAQGEPIRGLSMRRPNDITRSLAVEAGELAPAAIAIEPLGADAMNPMDLERLNIEAMDSIESIDVPGLAVAPLDVPVLPVGSD
jgi:hypothetical protein